MTPLAWRLPAHETHPPVLLFLLALLEYQAPLKQSLPNAPDRTLLEYRVAAALGASQHWDEALAAYTRDPLWPARVHYQCTLLLNQVPHQGYRISGHLYQRNDYPHTRSAEKPQPVRLQAEDAKAALQGFQAAAQEYNGLTFVPPLPGRYSHDPQAPHIPLIIAQWTEWAGDFLGSLRLYRTLLARYPSSKWADDARSVANGIVHRQIGIYADGLLRGPSAAGDARPALPPARGSPRRLPRTADEWVGHVRA